MFSTNETSRYLAAELDGSGSLYLQTESVASKDGRLHLANGGVYWVHPRALEPFKGMTTPVSLETEILPRAQMLGQVFCGLRCEETFIDIGVPEDYYRAQNLSCFL